MDRARVMTYNIRALKDDRAAVVEVIRSAQPDVVCLQEVPRHPLSGHRIAALAADCGLVWAGGADRGFMSTTLLTSLRVRVLASGHQRFPVRARDEPRGWAYARVRLSAGGEFTAVSTHLSLRTAEHVEHVELLRGAVELTGPVVIAGDLNETDTGKGWRRLADGLIDVHGGCLTFPARAPDRRIDAMFCSPELAPTDVPILADPVTLRRASDHVPLAVEVGPPRVA